MEAALSYALEYLSEDAKPENVDDDWFVNAYAKCRIVADPEMQDWWGRLLAAESNKPGSISRKTVNVMDDMDARIMRMFVAYCRFQVAVNGVDYPMIHCDYGDPGGELPPIYAQSGLDRAGLTVLSELGLVQAPPPAAHDLPPPVLLRDLPRIVFLYYGPETETLRWRPDWTFPIGISRFTSIGRELAPLCGPGEPVDGFLPFVMETVGRRYGAAVASCPA